MLENVIVWILVAGVAALTGRSLWRSLRGGKSACNCADGCPMARKCDADATGTLEVKGS